MEYSIADFADKQQKLSGEKTQLQLKLRTVEREVLDALKLADEAAKVRRTLLPRCTAVFVPGVNGVRIPTASLGLIVLI